MKHSNFTSNFLFCKNQMKLKYENLACHFFCTGCHFFHRVSFFLQGYFFCTGCHFFCTGCHFFAQGVIFLHRAFFLHTVSFFFAQISFCLIWYWNILISINQCFENVTLLSPPYFPKFIFEEIRQQIYWIIAIEYS